MDPKIRTQLLAGYRKLQSTLFGNSLFSSPFFSKERREDYLCDEKIWSQNGKVIPPCEKGKKRVWFHAASVGELESLWPVILEYSKLNQEIIVTILSDSAKSTLKRLKKEVFLDADKGNLLIFSGYSPNEGRWKVALGSLSPTHFVTAKYEAWPDLWISLKEKNIPLIIVSARARTSLRVAKKFCNLLSGDVPSLLLLTCLETDVPPLKKLFPYSEIKVVGEPRWDRVRARLTAGSVRSRQLLERFSSLGRPWGILGSAWLEDLHFLRNELSKISGTLWVVPHEINSANINKIVQFLKQIGIDPILTAPDSFSNDQRASLDLSLKSKTRSQCIVVNEMGFLSELYALSDWAFVGGGFGAGVHSTIEPAIHGIPLAAGPKGADKFSEITELSSSGQLRILSQEENLARWIRELNQNGFGSRKGQWKEEAQGRFGATQKILTAIENFKASC